METYRGYEIHPDMAGYGYVASLPEYDLGMTVVHGWSVDAVRREIDTQIADGEFPEPSVNLFDAVRGGVRP